MQLVSYRSPSIGNTRIRRNSTSRPSTASTCPAEGELWTELSITARDRLRAAGDQRLVASTRRFKTGRSQRQFRISLHGHEASSARGFASDVTVASGVSEQKSNDVHDPGIMSCRWPDVVVEVTTLRRVWLVRVVARWSAERVEGRAMQCFIWSVDHRIDGWRRWVRFAAIIRRRSHHRPSSD